MTEGKIAVLASFSGTGGVERMISNLLFGLLTHGARVELLLIRSDETSYLEAVPHGVKIIRLKARHNLSALPGLLRYIRAERPRAILAAKDRAIFVAALSKILVTNKIRIVGRLGTTVSVGMRGKPFLARMARRLMMCFSYRVIDETICVSHGVAQDLSHLTRIPEEKFHVVENPVITPRLYELADRPPEHPWLELDDGRPLIMGMGRLTQQKDFETLIDAFNLVNQRIPSRLIILGEGRKRRQLEEKIGEYGLGDVVALPGFTPNPYPFLKRANLFVLSSLWEGSPNALTEALALGTPVVSTDCPSGPREILQGGKFGPLVPMREPHLLAKAMVETLKAPPAQGTLKGAVREYSALKSARKYLDILLN